MQKRTETWLQSSGSGTGANGFIGEGEEPEGKNTFGTTSLADSLAYLVVLSLLYALGKKKGIYPYYCKKI
jgi:hypothetical protein